MELLEALRFQLDTCFNGTGWHGPTLIGSLRGVTPAEALRKPRGSKHCLWDLLLHTTYWKYTMLVRLGVAEPHTFPRSPSNWPRTPDSRTPAKELMKRWKADLKLARETHKAVVQAMLRLDPATLHQIPPGGKRATRWILLTGIAAHDVYHAGQCQLIKKMIRR